MTTSIGYIRKSSAPSKSVRTVSYEVQEQAVRELAGRHGDELPEILNDWGRSGGSTRRPDYQRLLGMVDRGEVRTIYSYSLSRLSRSLLDFADLLERCRTHDVGIRLVQEGAVDLSTATGRAFANMAATFAQFERELAVERNLAAVGERRARGDRLGQAPYGYSIDGANLVPRTGERPDLVIAAYRQAGTFGGAARLLNEWKVPTRRDGTRWIHGTVADILRAQGPDDLRPALVKRRGATPIGGSMFAGLLACPCGAVLTPRKDDGAPTGVSGYYCSRSSRTPDHGRMHVSEVPILEWAKGEAARLQLPEAVELIVAEDQQAAAELRGQRDRYIEMYATGIIRDKSDLDARVSAIDEKLEALETRSAASTVPTLDWSWDPATVNGVLRALWKHVELDADLRPVRAEWTVPEWRA